MTMGKKLDLSKLSDDEAKHVWEVIERDMSLRKNEEQRLEDLKEKLEKETSKRDLLCSQSHLNSSHCIHCLQPYQFLINSKRQCKDCQLYVCKNCSRYNKKEQGWVCDPCRISRTVKIGSHEWYYDHVRTRFKRFGSAKVLRSLYLRQLAEGRGGSGMTGIQDRVQSLPDINREYLRQARAGMFADEEDDVLDSAEAQRYSMMRKTKRLLSVHPYDFDNDSEYSAQSRRQSMQLSPSLDQDVFQSFSEYTSTGKDVARKESLLAEAELASVFHQLLQEQGQNTTNPDQEFSTEVRLTMNSRRRSLENIRRSSSPFLATKASQYSGDMDTSDEERGAIPKAPPRRRSRASSQENLHHSGTQISDLNKRMSAIERMLNRLEERISVQSDESTGQAGHTDADLEEQTLKRKIGELASNLSDKGGSSDEEKGSKPKSTVKTSNEDVTNQTQKRSAAQALCDITAKSLRTINATERAMQEAFGEIQQPVNPYNKPGASGKAHAEFQNLEENVYIVADKTYGLEKNLQDLEERARQSGTTDSELSELEVSVASAMAQVQQTESEVSDIESRIAALSAAGLTVSPSDKAKKKSSPRMTPPAMSRSTEPFLPSSPELYNLSSTPSEAKILTMQQALRKKFNLDADMADGSFERNALYRGSLTQRNPNGKNRKLDRIFAKPVLSQR
ncbi:melanophilin isoform 2-T3 [Leptodactylus fuscus]|uniref:melanophilin isoform X2 n=1 Tax=Leptodactylus fuscus TaxID=238119 RepID=UPI003F4EC5A7